jgi:hypothetical protein
MLRKLILAFTACLLMVGASQATTLIDTGTPDGTAFAGVVDSSDFLAVQFNATDAWRIDGLVAYLTGGQVGDHVALSLYRDAVTHVPGELIASTTVSFNADGWNGASGLGWQLASGSSYWVGVEGVDGYFNAPAGGLSMPGATAFADGSHQGAYQAYPSIQFGLQVTGAVPEPGSLALLLAGLVVVGGAAGSRASRKF